MQLECSESKPCKKCGTVKPLAQFYGDKSRPDGRRNSCIECDKVRKKTPEVHEQNRRYAQSAKGRAAAYRHYHEAGGKERDKLYKSRPEVKERNNERQRGPDGYSSRHWHKSTGKETYNKKAKTEEFRAHRREYAAEWKQRPEVKERFLARDRAYREKREAKKRQLPYTLTEDDWQNALSFFDHCCAYCGRSDMPLAQEHAIPLVSGGPYTPDNIVPSCISCNSSKRSRSWDEWATPESQERIREYFRTLLG